MKRTDSDVNNKQRSQNPRVNANIFEIITFSWMLDIFKTGRKRDLEETDLYSPLKDHNASALGDKLEEKWTLELINAKNMNRKPSLLRALIQTFGAEYMFYGFLCFINENIFKISQPLLIGSLLSYFNPEDLKHTEIQHAYKCASGLLLTSLIWTVVDHFFQMETSHCGMKMRIACCSLTYRKTLKLSNKAFGETTNGQMMNLISNDVNLFDAALTMIHYFWVGPLQTIIVTYFLWQEIGMSSLVGVFILICFIPLQGWLGKTIANIRKKMVNKTDERLRIINEIISGIQVIKMYTWEKPFSKILKNVRKREMTLIKGSSFIYVILISIIIIQTKLQIFASILTYVFLGNKINVQKVFVVTALFNLLLTSMTVFFSQSLTQIAEILVTVKRIQKFLLLEEKDNQTTQQAKLFKKKLTYDTELNDKNITKNNTEIAYNNIEHFNDYDIEIINATAKWTDDQTTNTLENINLTVKPGQLVAIIGPVGSGKSSMIQLILWELPLREGMIIKQGKVSYASQQPWLFEGSIQQNILFDSPKDEQRYTEVIKVCALKSDLDRFPHGDKTIVGERGITLSGGQKARISLARCIYKKADIYLLDDPLSAVDTRVGKHLFKNCIHDYLKEKTCILITHQLQYLTKADHIILMENAKIVTQGTYQEIRDSDYDILKFIESFEGTNEKDDTDIIEIDQSNEIFNGQHYSSSKDSIHKNLSSSIENFSNGDKEKPTNIAESRSSGRISKNIFISYFAAVGSASKVVMLFSTFIITQVLLTGVEFWLNFWLYQEEYVLRSYNTASTDSTVNMTCDVSDFISLSLICRHTYIIVYAILVILLLIACITRSMIFVSVTAKASTNLHNGMFNGIIRATMYFFNTNPSGRILNRFSNDIGAIDGILPSSLFSFLQIFMVFLGITFVVLFVNIFLIIPTILFGLALYFIRCFYLPTSQYVKRLEGVTKSPAMSHMNESLYGLTTIRAYKADKIVTELFDHYQDLHSSAWYLLISSNSAFGFWLDVISLSYINIVIFSFLFLDNNTYGGNVGLGITQIMLLSGMIQRGVRLTTIVENQIVSVERVLEYTNAPQENNEKQSTVKSPPIGWPNEGQIVFRNFYLRYSQDSSYVLKNLDFQIEPMEKIGIIGRTGAGKSSIISALFRLAINEGNIIIDGIDIHELSLHKLRSKISIIPQEPFLFSGTMRKNLDPFDEYPDHVLWKALDEVELKVVIENLPGGLNSKISENGSNLSVGQRQLVCLARAIVRNKKILILDEATANVDPQSDALIQNTIRDKFRTCTVLTIAHRLNTVMDSDKILVMNDGLLVEYGHPYNLLQNKNGFLYSMVEQSGQGTAELLHRVAADSFEDMKGKNSHFEAK